MPLIKTKPTSPGRRFVVKSSQPDLHKGEPYGPLVAPKSKSGGRNNKGRITSRHRGGGHKQRYRIIDFKRTKDGIVGRVERLEYDPCCSDLPTCSCERRAGRRVRLCASPADWT